MVPQGTTLVRASPAATQTADGHLVWKIGDLESGSKSEVEVYLMPIDEGEVGSVDMWITISSDPIDIALPSPDDVVDIEELFGSAFEDFAIDETLDTEED